MIEIRHEPYGSATAARLVDALHAEINVRYEGDDEDIEPEDFHAELGPDDLIGPNGAFLVAWLDGEPVGCGAIRRVDTMLGEIKRMYTEPSARRRGISRAILVALEEEAARLGYARLHLETGLRQPEAMAMYESAGWARIASYGHYKDSPLSACYGKDL
jgi:GNAT superfamily N-acetyltransferase